MALSPEMKGEFEGQVHVILVKDDARTGDDLNAELLAAPLSRDEANERGR